MSTRQVLDESSHHFERYRVVSLALPHGGVTHIEAWTDENGPRLRAELPSTWERSLLGDCINCAGCCLPRALSAPRIDRPLSAAEWRELRERINNGGFWSGAVFDDNFGVYDGVRFTLTGTRERETREVEASNPHHTPLLDAVDLLFELAGHQQAAGAGWFDRNRREIGFDTPVP